VDVVEIVVDDSIGTVDVVGIVGIILPLCVLYKGFEDSA
jgi:hypothetical protein